MTLVVLVDSSQLAKPRHVEATCQGAEHSDVHNEGNHQRCGHSISGFRIVAEVQMGDVVNKKGEIVVLSVSRQTAIPD